MWGGVAKSLSVRDAPSASFVRSSTIWEYMVTVQSPLVASAYDHSGQSCHWMLHQLLYNCTFAAFSPSATDGITLVLLTLQQGCNCKAV